MVSFINFRRILINSGSANKILKTKFFISWGDSNAAGAAEASDQNNFVSSYVINPLNKVWSPSTGDFVTWTPGTMAGIVQGNEAGHVGPEAGFFKRANEMYPGQLILLYKDTYVGSYASRGPIFSSFNGSISAGGTLTVNSGTAPTTSKSLEGVSIPLPGPIHTTTSATALRTKPNPTYSSGAVASQDMTSHTIGISWDLNSGSLYTGYYFGAAYAQAFKSRLTTALEKLNSSYFGFEYLGSMVSIFGNDGTDSTAASRAQASFTALISRMRSDFPLIASKPIYWTRPRNASPSGSVVRSAFLTLIGSDTQLYGIEKDDLPLASDGIHLTIAGLQSVGQRSFDEQKISTVVPPSSKYIVNFGNVGVAGADTNFAVGDIANLSTGVTKAIGSSGLNINVTETGSPNHSSTSDPAVGFNTAGITTGSATYDGTLACQPITQENWFVTATPTLKFAISGFNPGETGIKIGFVGTRNASGPRNSVFTDGTNTRTWDSTQSPVVVYEFTSTANSSGIVNLTLSYGGAGAFAYLSGISVQRS